MADALPVLTDRVIIPFSGWCDGNSNMSREMVDPEVFFNATGCLRCEKRACKVFFPGALPQSASTSANIQSE